MSEKETTTIGDYLETRRENELRGIGLKKEDIELPSKEEPQKSDEPKTYKLKDGSVVTEKELLDGYYRQSDYTKKTMDLAQEKKEYEQRKQELEAFVNNMDYYYDENPDAYNAVKSYFSSKQGGEIPVEDKSSRTQEKKEKSVSYEFDKKISSLEKELTAMKQRQSADRTQFEVDKAIAQFESAHNNLSRENVDEILRLAEKNIVPDRSPLEIIENAYKLWDYENLSKSRMASQEQQRLEKIGSTYFGGGDKGGLKRKTDGEMLIDAIFAKQPDSLL